MIGINIEYSNCPSIDSNESINPLYKLAISKVAASIKNRLPYYKIFDIQHAKSQAEACLHHAAEINKKFSDLIVIGMGGASLNPRTLVTLYGKAISPTRLHFLDNTDPFFLKQLLSKISLQNTAILAISNSGETLETNSLVGVLIAEFHKIGLKEIGDRFYFITNTQSGTLKDIANKIGATVIAHTANISGRYSGLTNVTTFAAQIAGINVDEYLDGANLVLEDFLSKEEKSSAAISACTLFTINKPIIVNIGYLQQFSVFCEWYSQIIAESLGKDGKGVTPIRGLGPNDQHSMLQLYLDGPQDKFYSLFYAPCDCDEYKTPKMTELGFIADKTLKNINDASYQAALGALNGRGLPTKAVILSNLSAKSVGALVAHSMLEIILLGEMMQINPFNQPSVQLIKEKSSCIIQKT